MFFYLVEFANTEKDEIKCFLLDEKKHDDWCACEPPQGYYIFRTIWHGEIENIICKLNDAKDIVIKK